MDNSNPIHIMIVDDQEMVGEGIAQLMRDEQDFQIKHVLRNPAQVKEIIEDGKEQIDVIIMDLCLIPGSDEPVGLELAKEIKQFHHRPGVRELKIIIISFSKPGNIVHKAYNAGIDGYITKEFSAQELKDAIHVVANGGMFYRGMVRDAMDNFVRQRDPFIQLEALTPRETDVLHCIACGLTNDEMAGRLKVKRTTIDTHRQSILRKFNANNSPHAVAIAYREEIINSHSLKEYARNQ